MAFSPTLAFDAMIALIAGSVYVYVASIFRKRNVSSEAKLASNAFAVWWAGLGASTFLGAIGSGAAAVGLVSVDLLVFNTGLSLLAVCAALGGLLYYLVYLFTGSRKWFVPIVVFYVVFYAYLTFLITSSNPNGFLVGKWRATLQYETPLLAQFTLPLLLFLVLPQILGALAYGSLWFSIEDRAQRMRVLLVSLSILVWFGSSIAATVTGVSQSDTYQIVSRFVGLTAALVILAAYRPPPFLARGLGLAPSARPPGDGPGPDSLAPAGPGPKGSVVTPIAT